MCSLQMKLERYKPWCIGNPEMEANLDYIFYITSFPSSKKLGEEGEGSRNERELNWIKLVSVEVTKEVES